MKTTITTTEKTSIESVAGCPVCGNKLKLDRVRVQLLAVDVQCTCMYCKAETTFSFNFTPQPSQQKQKERVSSEKKIILPVENEKPVFLRLKELYKILEDEYPEWYNHADKCPKIAIYSVKKHLRLSLLRIHHGEEVINHTDIRHALKIGTAATRLYVHPWRANWVEWVSMKGLRYVILNPNTETEEVEEHGTTNTEHGNTD